MSNIQGTKPLPAPSGDRHDWREASHPPEQGGGGVIIVFLLGIVAWGVALLMIAGAEDQDVPVRSYAMGIAATIVGSALILAAAIYDATRRLR